jgi:O-antigen ligase
MFLYNILDCAFHVLIEVMKRYLGGSALLYGVFGLLLLCPLAFGTVEPWSIYALEMFSSVLFTFWVVQQISAGVLEIRWHPLFAPMLVFAGLIVLQLAIGSTAYKYATLSAGLLYWAYGFLCFLVAQSLRRTSQVKNLALALSSYGCSVAIFALLQGLTFKGKLYWLRTPSHGGWIYGPYVNHNHYAGLMEMLFPVPLVFSLTNHARGGLRRVAVLASVVMATTIFLSGSRGGGIAFLCEIVVLLVAVMRQQNRIPFRGRLILVFFAVFSLASVALVGDHSLNERLTSVDSTEREMVGGMRQQIDRDLIKMFPHRLLLGWGLGTFADVYPQYRSFYTSFLINEAHNDYLQLLIELGAAGFIVMIWFLYLVFRLASTKLNNWATDVNGAVALAAVLGITGILVHSLVDFNLQVPANASMFYVLCVIATMESRFESVRGRMNRAGRPQYLAIASGE